VTDVAPTLAALCRTMEKIHRARDIALVADPDARFRGEKQDLEEMVGNLVDNACKWADSQVRITAAIEQNGRNDPSPVLRIIVDDDGAGLSDSDRATDLAALYGGSLTLGQAPIGGLRADLALPGTVGVTPPAG
ncbi:MAG: sensor histidine kinase, partial [Hyphomicrobiales bacterium]|nr:sensor histidine kinase [Hyphomicrobiales bacterium]